MLFMTLEHTFMLCYIHNLQNNIYDSRVLLSGGQTELSIDNRI